MKSIRLSPTCIVSVPEFIDQSIIVNGRIWRFEFDRRLGPLWLKADGFTPRECQNPKKAVWEAFEIWMKENVK